MNHEKTFEAINKLKEVEIELHRLKNALEMTNRALETKDEPVAWYCKEGLKRGVSLKQESPEWTPLYTIPQRTWVGLDINEFKFIASKYLLNREVGLEYFQEEIESKLKERNT